MELSGVTLKRLAPADWQTYRELRLAALQLSSEAFGSTYQEELPRGEEESRARLAGSAIWAAFAGGKPVGMVALHRHARARDRHKGEIFSMYVAPELHGRGIGRALLEAALQAAREQGLEQVTLYVVAGNQAATALYSRCGFQVYGTEPKGIKYGPGRYGDYLLMVKFLDRPAL